MSELLNIDIVAPPDPGPGIGGGGGGVPGSFVGGSAAGSNVAPWFIAKARELLAAGKVVVSPAKPATPPAAPVAAVSPIAPTIEPVSPIETVTVSAPRIDNAPAPIIAPMLELTVFGAKPAPAPSRRRAPVRRSKPAPKPSRRQRPTTKPAPGPRAPPTIFPRPRPGDPWPEFGKQPWIRGVMRFLGGPLAPFLFNIPETGDGELRPGQRPLWPVPPARERQPDATDDPLRLFDAGPVADLIELTVSAPRARPQPAPRIAPDLATFPMPYPTLSPRPLPAPRPGAAPAPAARPQPDLSPLLSPLPSFVPRQPPKPRPAPGARPGAPLVTAAPNIPTFLNPVPDLGPVPKEQLDRCNCPKPKKRKPRDARTECKRGTYRQTAKGIIYTPKETIQCQ